MQYFLHTVHKKLFEICSIKLYKKIITNQSDVQSTIN
jgi:hypothetical protein